MVTIECIDLNLSLLIESKFYFKEASNHWTPMTFLSTRGTGEKWVRKWFEINWVLNSFKFFENRMVWRTSIRGYYAVIHCLQIN